MGFHSFCQGIYSVISAPRLLWMFPGVDRSLAPFLLLSFFFFFYLFLIILCTMASVVRLFPLSTVRRIPFLLGSCVWIKHEQINVIYHPWGLQYFTEAECSESYSIRVGSVLVRIYFCLSVAYKIHLGIKRPSYNCREYIIIIII